MSITQSSTRLTALVAGVAVAAALIAGAFAATPAQAAALTQSQISSIISLLQSFGADSATIANVQASLNGQPTSGTGGSTSTGGACYAWTRDLQQGSTGADVMALQKFLNGDPATMVAVSGAGSPGNETSTFGPATKAAVIKFQTKYNVTPIAGYFGAKSRAQAAVVCGGTSGGNTGGNTGTGAAVVSAAAQPANAIAPQGASRVPYTAFTVTANGSNVTLNSVTVQRQGPSLDTDFSGVVLVDAATGVQLGTARVLDANHSATIGSPITIPAGTSKTFWVSGNIAACPASGTCTTPGSGDVASFAVTAVNTNSTVSGSLPIVGASNTINTSLSIGTAQIQTSSFDPNNAGTQPVGTNAYRFTGIRVQAGSAEDVTFKSITWYQSGSASGLQNVMTVVNGTSYPAMADATGRYYTTVFPSGIVIPKGQSVDVYVTADLGANTIANTYAEFDIYRNTDIYLVGNTYGYGITPTVTTGGCNSGSYSSSNSHCTIFVGGTNTPWIQGSTVSVTGGTFSTIQNATSVGAQNIAINVPNQPLGGFQTNLTGEGVQVQSLKIDFTTSTSTPLLQNVSLVDENGAVVAGPYNATCSVSGSGNNANNTCGANTGGSQTVQSVTFTGAINFPTGSHTYTLKGQVQSGTNNGAIFQAATTPNSTSYWSNVTGQTSGNTVSINVGNFTMNPMTVQSATLSVSNGTTPVSNSTVVSGGQGILFATFQLDASQSGENVRLSSIPVQLVADSAGSQNYLSSCQLFNGATALNTGSNVVNSSNFTLSSGSTYTTSFGFDNGLTIPKGTVVNLQLECNLSSSAGGSVTYAFSPTTSISPTGVTSGSSVAVSSIGGSAPTIKVTTGATLVASTDSSSPAYSIVAGGTAGVNVNIIKLRATNEAVNLQKVGLSIGAAASSSDITTAYIYAGNNIFTTTGTAVTAGTQIGTVTFTGGSVIATSTLTQTVQIPVNTDATLVVKADVAKIGLNQPGHEGDIVKIDYDSARGTGANSGKTIDATKISGFTGSSGIRTFASYPVISAGPSVTASPNGNAQVLKKFSVTASNAGSIGLNKFVLSVSTSTGVTVTNFKLFAYTDSGYSNAANVPGTSSGLFGAAIVGGGPSMVFSQSANSNAPLEVGAGQTVYFALVGDASVSGSTWTVGTTLQGDSSFSGMLQAATVSGNFVWSPNATTTAGVNDADWTNGAAVPGLPSTGL
ncbi:MAG TPA: peptidoglycan-binding domain-containing protein [Candidatus Paceibacterota bacterium]|nr:peptidoglycan-binding domain-containing protein [Candidatus Paceibacterota bacterium]